MASVVRRLRAAGCVFAEDEADLLVAAAGSSGGELEALVAQRVAGLPLEHVVGWARFCGMRVLIGPNVFVPRHRSELLVREAVASVTGRAAEPQDSPLVVLDLCCGSGALGVVAATRLRQLGREVELHAADVEPAAVQCARSNVEPIGGTVHEGDLYDPVPDRLRGRVDVLVANVPYVPSGQIGLMPREARDFEPLVTLDGGADGLDVLRRVAGPAPRWLAAGGHLLVESSERQAPLVAEIFEAVGLVAGVAEDDDLGATVVIGRLPA